MDMIRLLLWIASAALFAVLTVFAGKAVRNRCPLPVCILAACLKALAVPLTGLLMVYWDTPFTWRCNMLLGGFYVAALGSVCADILRFAVTLADRFIRPSGEKDSRLRNRIRNILGLHSGIMAEVLIIAAVFLYGTLNMMIVTPRSWTVRDSRLESGCKIVFVSDIHAGSAQPYAVLEKMMKDIKKEQPDLLVVGGDVTDEFSSKEDAEKVWKVIGDAGLPTVAVWGNHDRQKLAVMAHGSSYTEEELKEIIQKNGIRLLEDEYLKLRPDLVLYGREDISEPDRRKTFDPAGSPCPEAFTVLLDHQQMEGGRLKDMGRVLQLSGHSHDGQYFPLNLIYTLAGAYPSGRYEVGASELIVSSGCSGWRNPFRTQGHCHYEVIRLEPEN